MARADVTVNLTIKAAELFQTVCAIQLLRSKAGKQTLMLLRENKRISPRLYACIAWPKAWGKGGRALLGASENATQRLRAAAKAGLAHVAFEQGEETYEISARGRAALSGRT